MRHNRRGDTYARNTVGHLSLLPQTFFLQNRYTFTSWQNSGYSSGSPAPITSAYRRCMKKPGHAPRHVSQPRGLLPKTHQVRPRPNGPPDGARPKGEGTKMPPIMTRCHAARESQHPTACFRTNQRTCPATPMTQNKNKTPWDRTQDCVAVVFERGTATGFQEN